MNTNKIISLKRSYLLIIICLIFIFIIAYPHIKMFKLSLQLNNAMENAYNYKDSINKYYYGKLMSDSSFKLDGKYVVSNGKIYYDSSNYDVLFIGSVSSEGFLNYINNKLESGCIMVDKYSFIITNEEIVQIENCDDYGIDVAVVN